MTADERGSFVIEDLDRELLFNVLVLAEGYRPQYAKKVDPQADEITVRMERVGPPPEDPRQVVFGRIVDGEGDPVAGAVISASSVHYDNGGGTWGEIEGLDPYAVSDASGSFRICHTERVDAIGIDVRAPGFAPQLARLRTGKDVRVVRLDAGATITGRLITGGTGVAGVVLGLVQTSRSVEVFMGETTIATDDEGRFTFNNVARGHEYAVYGKMESLRAHGATALHLLRVDAATVDVGDMEVTPGHRVAGRVITTDGSKLPDDVRVLLSNDVAWDSQLAVLDPEARFSMRGVPSGTYGLTLRVPGYRLTARNISLRPAWPTSLEGRVDGDLDELIIELEPGKPEPATGSRELFEREQKLRGEPLRGVPAGK